MRSLLLSFTLLSAVAAAPAMAQTTNPGPAQDNLEIMPAPPSHQPTVHHPTNLNAQTTRSIISPALPPVNLGPNATAADYLRAAQNDLSAGQLGRTQEALENAETLLLTRAVPLGATDRPDQSPAVQNISRALQALASGDRATTSELIRQTLPMAERADRMRQGMQEASTGRPGMENPGMAPQGQAGTGYYGAQGQVPPPPAGYAPPASGYGAPPPPAGYGATPQPR